MTRLFLALLLLPLTVLPARADEAPPTLTVRGEARLEIPADQARLNLAVITTADDAESALQQNNARLRAVEKELTAAGLEKNEYHTGQFAIRPDWSPRPHDAKPDWKPAIVGYTVTNSIEVKTVRLTAVGRLIEAAARAGADNIQNLTFDLADPASHRDAAIAAATSNARGEALALAAAADVRLGPVLSLDLEPAGTPPRPRVMRMAAEAATVPITPGNVEIRAGVTVVYRIEQP
jgi:uncharacterized protein YggE